MICTNCPAFKFCPEKPVREDYADENKYLIDLECGVWSCQKTVEKLCKKNEQNIKLFKELKEHCDELELINQKVMEENEQIKEYNTDLKQSLDWANERETEWSNRIEELKTDLEYAKAIIKDLLNNSHEYSRQNAEDFIKGANK
jgi:chromosome segregation ATPase